MQNEQIDSLLYKSLSLASKMIEVAEFENLDLLHVHYAIPHATSAYLAKKILKKNKDYPYDQEKG